MELTVEEATPKRQLTVELVPSSCWFHNLRSELSRADWDRCKKWAADKFERRCAICGGRGSKHPVECHEIWSYDDSILVQRLDGLIALCPSCHEVKHIGFAEMRGRLELAIAHLCWVNQWQQGEAIVYLEAQFALWRRRSMEDWTLDISWLERELGISVDTRREQQL